MSKKMDPEAAKDCLLTLAKVLDWVDLPFFLIQGTALGAHREGRFIPHDKDIDVGCLQEHLQPKVTLLVDQLVDADFSVRIVKKPFNRPRCLKLNRLDIHIDLNGFCLWKHERFCANAHKDYAIVYPREMKEQYDTVEFYGRRFNVPHPIDKYLVDEYGSGWRTPKLDSRSRTRFYGYIKARQIPTNLLEQYDE